MKKGIFSISIILALVLVFGVVALEFKECNRGCIDNTAVKLSKCNSNFDSCSETANTHISGCSLLPSKNKSVCIKEARNELTKCKDTKKVCLKEANDYNTRCKKKCYYLGKNITCEGGKYNAGDVFLKECNKCECNSNGKISCKSTEYCGLDAFDISKEKCQEGNGLYQKLCAGSIMSTKCTTETFCQCGGKLGLSCPEGYSCLYDFYLNKNRKGQFAQEWVRLAEYKKLGNIGVCVKKPAISLCGDGVCDSICKDYDCSNSETKYSCPEDC